MQGKDGARHALGYFSIVRRGKGSGYTVSFPDVPDCGAEGTTVDDAMLAARSFHQVIMSTDIKGVIAFVMI